MESLVAIVFVLWGAPILLAWGLGRSRGRAGWAWGLLLGWLGVLILACMRPRSATELAEIRTQQAKRKSFRLSQ